MQNLMERNREFWHWLSPNPNPKTMVTHDLMRQLQNYHNKFANLWCLDEWGKCFVEWMISSSKHSYGACMKIMWNRCLNSWNEWKNSLYGPHKTGNKWLSFWNEWGKHSHRNSWVSEWTANEKQLAKVVEQKNSSVRFCFHSHKWKWAMSRVALR